MIHAHIHGIYTYIICVRVHLCESCVRAAHMCLHMYTDTYADTLITDTYADTRTRMLTHWSRTRMLRHGHVCWHMDTYADTRTRMLTHWSIFEPQITATNMNIHVRKTNIGMGHETSSNINCGMEQRPRLWQYQEQPLYACLYVCIYVYAHICTHQYACILQHVNTYQSKIQK